MGERVLWFYLYTNKENSGQEGSVYGSVPGNIALGICFAFRALGRTKVRQVIHSPWV